jgi:hypothetical protein
MKRLFKCPFCGHVFRVSETRLSKGLTCPACKKEVKTVAADAPAEPSTPRAAGAKASLGGKLVKMTLGDATAVLEGSVPGAISGLLTGILGALLIGIITGEDAGLITAKVLIGFIGGFGIGTAIAMIVVSLGRRVRPNFRIEPGIFSTIVGAAIGSAVSVLVEEIRWIPLGAAIGAVAANLWPLLSSRLEAIVNPPKPVPLEEDSLLDNPKGSNRYSI